jgi:hypothetical protein
MTKQELISALENKNFKSGFMSTYFLTRGEKDTEEHKQLSVRVVDGYVKVSYKFRFLSMGVLSSAGRIAYEGESFEDAMSFVNQEINERFLK